MLGAHRLLSAWMRWTKAGSEVRRVVHRFISSVEAERRVPRSSSLVPSYSFILSSCHIWIDFWLDCTGIRLPNQLPGSNSATFSNTSFTPSSSGYSSASSPPNYEQLRSSLRQSSAASLDDDERIIFSKSNVLMLGPTGTGKTHLLRTLAG